MKRSFIIFTLALATISCNTFPEDILQEDACVIQVGVNRLATKAPQTQTSAEKQVNTLDLFIFDTDSEALLFKQRVSAASAEVRITKGARTFYALVNAPAAASALSTLSEVAAYHAAFADQGRSSFFMAGSKAVTVTSATTEVVVDVRRDVARVDLVNAPTFSGQAAGATFNAAYLINVPKTYSASATVAAAADAWNFGDAVATASEQDALLKLTAAGSVYGMPNTTAEAAAIDGTDYVTKLVIKATVNGSVYWYPIGIPGIASNKRYVVENVYIKGVGSDTPNAYVDNQVLSTSVNVLDWNDAEIEGHYHEDFFIDPLRLTFEIATSGNIIWKCSDDSIAKTIEYSKDDGVSWTKVTSTTSGALIPVSTGEKLLVRGNNAAYATSSHYNFFDVSDGATFYAIGNINYLTGKKETISAYAFRYLFYNNTGLLSTGDKHLTLPATALGNYCCSGMFHGCTQITVAPELPATTLAEGCYMSMFAGCTELADAPELPATSLAGSCYYAMFNGCINLTTAPELPATSLANKCYYCMFSMCHNLTCAPDLPALSLESYCYQQMFLDCTSLTTAPALPATTLSNGCYYAMFVNCTSLVAAPQLPATTLTNNCYANMFQGCTSLTTAPDLPAITLESDCYREMFLGCFNLKYIKALFTTTPSQSYTRNWVSGVPSGTRSGGTFVKNSAAEWDVFGVNGIPNGWTVEYLTP